MKNLEKKSKAMKQITIDLDEETLEILVDITQTSGFDAEVDAIKAAIRFTIDNY